MENQIEIPISKTKIYRLLLIGGAFFITGLYILIFKPEINNSVFKDPVLLKAAAIGVMTFLPLSMLTVFNKIKQSKPGLTINSVGIDDNSASLPTGLIYWSDVIGIRSQNQFGQNLILIGVRNPQDYIDRQNSFIKRMLMRSAYSSSGTPIIIGANALATDFESLIKSLKKDSPNILHRSNKNKSFRELASSCAANSTEYFLLKIQKRSLIFPHLKKKRIFTGCYTKYSF